MYLKHLKEGIKASDATMQNMLNAVPIATFEQEEDSTVELRVIDPPIVNGIHLAEHPNPMQRAKFKSILNSGGIICGLYKNGKMELLCPLTMSGRIGRTLEDFEEDRADLVTRKVAHKIRNELDKGLKHIRNGRVKRPHTLTPDDFWAQFNPSELAVINLSEITSVVDFVAHVNGLTTVPLQSNPIKNGINMLYANEVISSRTYAELTEV